MRVPDSFFKPGRFPDVLYTNLRDLDHPPLVRGREFVEHIWTTCAPYVDADLPSQAPLAFLQRFWELYVAYTLLQNRIELVPRAERRFRRKGPDFLLADGVTWVEAVLASDGTGPDAVPEPVDGTAFWVPHDKIKLRLLSAIHSKLRKYHQYRRDNVLTERDSYIIAVGGRGVRLSMIEQSIPTVVSSVLPFGPEQVHLDSVTLEVRRRSHAYQPNVVKSSGSNVPTTLFLTPESKPITALLYAWADPVNRADRAGDDFSVVHNPNASISMPRGRLAFGREYWFADNRLHWQTHRDDRQASKV